MRRLEASGLEGFGGVYFFPTPPEGLGLGFSIEEWR